MTTFVNASELKVLITGFNPFGGEKINPSYEAIKRLPDNIAGAKIIKIEIPTEFKKSKIILNDEIAKYKPNYVINVGQAAGRAKVSIERVAINIDDARIKDNAGYQPIDTKVHKDGKNAYFTELPIKKIVSELKKENKPIELSNTAGTFVCNSTMYHVQYLIDKKYPNIKAGFIHIPFTKEQAIRNKNDNYLEIKDATAILKDIIKIIIENDGKKDSVISYGKLN